MQGTKENRSNLPVVPRQSGSRLESSYSALLTMGKVCFSMVMYIGSIQLCLQGSGEKRNRRPRCMREVHHRSFATNYFGVIFSLREFFAKLLAEQLIHCFSASMLFSLLKKVRRLFTLNFPLLSAKVSHSIQELQSSLSQAQWLRNTQDQLHATLNFGLSLIKR